MTQLNLPMAQSRNSSIPALRWDGVSAGDRVDGYAGIRPPRQQEAGVPVAVAQTRQLGPRPVSFGGTLGLCFGWGAATFGPAFADGAGPGSKNGSALVSWLSGFCWGIRRAGGRISDESAEPFDHGHKTGISRSRRLCRMDGPASRAGRSRASRRRRGKVSRSVADRGLCPSRGRSRRDDY
jgi:hypothetical protein